MKRYVCLFALAVLPLSAQWRRFGSDVHPSGFAGVGFTTPVNPAARRLDTGWNVTGGIGVTNNYFGIMLEGMFNDMGITRQALVRQGVRDGSEKYWAFTLNPVFHVNERGPVDFYVTGGAGIYSQVTSLRAVAESFRPGGREFEVVSTNYIYKPGVNAGAGFAFRVGDFSNLKFFAEARYHRMFIGPSDVSFVPVTIGVRF